MDFSLDFNNDSIFGNDTFTSSSLEILHHNFELQPDLLKEDIREEEEKKDEKKKEKKSKNSNTLYKLVIGNTAAGL